MNLTPECVGCLFNQALKACRTVGADDETTKKVLDATACEVPKWRFDVTPPAVAAELYPLIGRLLGRDDLYAAFKAASTERARALLSTARKRIEEAEDPLLAALKAAVAGNVIDLAASRLFDLKEEIRKVFDTPFGIDHVGELAAALAKARTVMVVGDNVGEHLFDKLLLETLRRLYPRADLAYAVRGAPIINDVTYAEAEAAGIGEVAEILDSGVDTPGLEPQKAAPDFLRRFESTDVIIAKGMGNFESLEARALGPIWYLLKIKCDVVAARIGRPVGDIICMKGAPDA